MENSDVYKDANYVGRHFQALVHTLGHKVKEPHIWEEWHKIYAAYTEPHRYYHDISHIASVLRFCAEMGVTDKGSASGDALTKMRAFAIYHDFVYSVGADKSRNEELSAEHARDFLRIIGAQPDLLDFVEGAILATRKHRPEPALGFWGDFALDADMVVLASDPKPYKDYVAGVRAEFKAVSDADFDKARINQFLLATLRSNRIFNTDTVHRWYEAKARGNMDREVAAINARRPGTLSAT